jgi:predicted transcriptional regulator
MLRPVRSTFKRKPNRRVVSRSFRVPPDVDKALDRIARDKGWTKSFLIRDVLVGYVQYQTAEWKVK